MDKGNKKQKIWINLSETINTGEYQNVKIEAGFSRVYTDKENPVELIDSGIEELRSVLKKQAKKIRRK